MDNPSAVPVKIDARSRALGCMLGLAVGDALGDLGRMDEYRQRYGIVTSIYDGAGSTDDTEFALLTARALIECKGELTSDAVVEAWCKYVIEQGGVLARGGRPQYGAVANLRRGMRPPLSGRDNVGNDDDGAAMRIAPVGIVCAGDPERAAELAAIDAQISHYADGVWAAQAVAASVAIAMTGADPEAIIDAGLQQIPEDSWLGRAMARAMGICEEAQTIARAWERLHTDLWTPTHSACAEAIPQTYAIFRLTHGEFREGMFWAANFGRDADTIAAVVGALSGARHGVDIIPREWIEKVRKPSGVCLRFTAEEDVLLIAEQLAALIR